MTTPLTDRTRSAPAVSLRLATLARVWRGRRSRWSIPSAEQLAEKNADQPGS